MSIRPMNSPRPEQLKLHVIQDYNGEFLCTDDNYDGAPDSGNQPTGTGITALNSVIAYLMDNDIDPNIDYIISGKDLI